MVAQINKAYTQTGKGRALVRLLSYALFEGRPLTTRGRWMNPLVFALSWLLCRVGSDIGLQKPIFIVGTGRSGTTILGTILSVHPDVGFLNEPKAMWHRAVPNEDVIGSYSELPGSYYLGSADATPLVTKRLRRLYRNYLRIVRRRRVVDKYPEAVYRAEFILSAMPDARIIWVVRDGIDTVGSISRWSATHGSEDNGASDNWWGRNDRKWFALVDQLGNRDEVLRPHLAELRAISEDADRAALEWSLNTRQGLAILDRYPSSVMQLRYEDLVRDSDATLGSLLQFCELGDDDGVAAFARAQINAQPPKEATGLTPVVAAHFDETMKRANYR